MDDGAEMHGKRLADWIIEKMGGEGKPWSDSGREGQRQPSHRSAWNNKKRPRAEQGDHFNLHDVTRWMCIHFWSLRECGLDQHKVFFDWYVKFISHFSSVYDSKAPAYAQAAADWSSNAKNIEDYQKGLPGKSIVFNF